MAKYIIEIPDEVPVSDELVPFDMCRPSWYWEAYKKGKADAEKEKEEIHVGDEVTEKTDTDKDMPKGIVTYNNPEQSQFLVIKSDGTFSWWHKGGLRKTGRHFDEVEKLLERMKAE